MENSDETIVLNSDITEILDELDIYSDLDWLSYDYPIQCTRIA